jgi:hypothetical protein
MKNAVYWDMTPRGSCKNRLFRGTYRLHHQGKTNQQARNSVNSNQQLIRAAKKYISIPLKCASVAITANIVLAR